MNLKLAFSKASKSTIVQYIGFRYIAFGLQFINSIFIAKYLGVYYFGVFSFIFLVSQYLINLGMTTSYSLNAILSAKKSNGQLVQKVWDNALLLNIVICFSISIIGELVFYIYPALFAKYSFSNYKHFVLLYFVLTVFNSLYINLFRAYARLNEINFNQIIVPFLQLMVLFFAKEYRLLLLLLWATIIANVLSVIYFYIKSPLKHQFNFNIKISHTLLIRGFHLLLYNISFYLILLMARTIVSIFFTAEKLGYFTLAVNISNAVFMVVGSLSFIVYPKMVNKFSSNNNVLSLALVNEIRSIYIAGCYVLTYIGFCSIPLLKWLLPKYTDAILPLEILLLTQLILNNSFGYSAFLIAQKLERYLTRYALFALVIVAILGTLLSVLKFDFYTVAIPVAVGFLFYCLLLTKKCLSVLENKSISILQSLQKIFPINYLIPFLILMTTTFQSDLIFTTGLSSIVFVVMNKERITAMILKAKALIYNNNSINF